MGNRNLAAKYRGEAVRLLSQLRMGIQPFISRVFPDGTRLQILRGPTCDVINIFAVGGVTSVQEYVIEQPWVIFLIYPFYGNDLANPSYRTITAGVTVVNKSFQLKKRSFNINPHLSGVEGMSTLLPCNSYYTTQDSHAIAYPFEPELYTPGIMYYGATIPWLFDTMVGYISGYCINWETLTKHYAQVPGIGIFQGPRFGRHPWIVDEDGLLEKYREYAIPKDYQYQKRWFAKGSKDEGWTDMVLTTEDFSVPAGYYSYEASGTKFELTPGFPPLFTIGTVGCPFTPYHSSQSGATIETTSGAISPVPIESIDTTVDVPSQFMALAGESAIHITTTINESYTQSTTGLGSLTITRTISATQSVGYISPEGCYCLLGECYKDYYGGTPCDVLSGQGTDIATATGTYDVSAHTYSRSYNASHELYIGSALVDTAATNGSENGYLPPIVTGYTHQSEHEIQGLTYFYCGWFSQQPKAWQDPIGPEGCAEEYIEVIDPLNQYRYGSYDFTERSISCIDYDHSPNGDNVLILYTINKVITTYDISYHFHASWYDAIYMDALNLHETVTESREFKVALKIGDTIYKESLGSETLDVISCQINKKFAAFTYVKNQKRYVGLFNISIDKMDEGHYEVHEVSPGSNFALNGMNTYYAPLGGYDYNAPAIIGAHFLTVGTEKK
jgi:hypothetical protein